MKNKKIIQTKKAKEHFTSPILETLKNTDDNVPYFELCNIMNTSKRTVRAELSQIALFYALISLSDGNKGGHRIACNLENTSDIEKIKMDLIDVEHMIRELKSRVLVLQRRMKPLIAWKKIAENKINQNNE